jgi:spore maturation protein CgeB
MRFIPEVTVGCTFDRHYEKRLKDWGLFRVFTLPLGTNPERLLSCSPADERKMLDTPTLSFVGSLEYKKIQYLLKNIARSWRSMPPNMVTVLEKAIEQYRKMPRADAEDVIAACAGAMGVAYRFPDGVVKQMVLSFLDREASFRQRREIIEGLKPLGISVFGEPFWEKVVGKPFYKGSVNYYSPEIVHLYRSSSINLNISKYQLKTTVNQRVFDCPLCDGFLISDYREEISNYFEVDKSMVVYSDLEDLVGKITYYLGHEKEANRIMEEGKGTVLDRHTYGHRLEEMFNRVKKIRDDGSFWGNCRQALKGSMPASLPTFLSTLRQEISSHHGDSLVSIDMPVLDDMGSIERFIHG